MTQINDGQQTSGSFGGQQGQGPQGAMPPWTPPQGQAPQWGLVPGQPQYWGPQPPAGWQQPNGAPYPYPMMQPYFVPVQQPATRATNGTAIFAFIMSLLWLGGIGSLIGLILGISSAKECDRTGEGGHGLATAAAILGVFGLLVALVALAGS